MLRQRLAGIAVLAAIVTLIVTPATVIRAAGAPDETPATTPPWPTKGWQVATPESQGMDSGRLAQLIDTVGARQQDSLLIVRHGKLVADAYYAPYVAGLRHDLRSVTKSVTGTLIAIALKNGILDSVDHPVVDLFADNQIDKLDYRKKAITIQHLLDMTSGIAWKEEAYTSDETLDRMYRSKNPTEFVLGQEMSRAPGERFYYNSGNPYLLSALINKKTGQNALEFAKRELFGPLGITDIDWGRPDAQGVTDGEAGLYIPPHDMAKIGYLYLQNGVWEGREIIPPSWVDRAAEGKIVATADNHYANLWWSIPEKGAYMARGLHSQLIMVLPKLDIVAVLTGSMRKDEFYPTRRLIDDIAGAVKSESALPDDPVAQALLAASIRNAATPRPSPLGLTPELAKDISGKTYRFTENAIQVGTFSLNLFGDSPSWKITTVTGKPEQTRRFTGPLGLDGNFRTGSPVSYGVDAVRGRWTNANTFVVERRILGHSEMQSWTLAFEGKKVTVNFENTDSYKLELHGETTD